jgi:myo-inositol-1(or 4)-monophosphatase
MHDPSPELSSMVLAARTAGAGLMARFRARAELVVELKGPADFVSLADREAEETIRGLLLRAYPDYGFLAEESANAPGRERERAAETRFIVDPLDGTTNFLSGIPHFAIAIALERAGRVVAGVTFDPALDEMFVAEEGRGAWLGKERLAVSDDADFSRAIVGTGIPHANRRERHAAYLPKLAAVMHEVAGIRRMSSAALDLAYVAAGRFAAYFEFGLSPWDVAAGTLLVREAGGRVSQSGGDERVLDAGDVLATNGRLHEPMMKLLRPGGPSA